VQGADEVLSSETETGADDNRLLADARVHAAADIAVIDKDEQPDDEGAIQLQQVEQLKQLFGRELEFCTLDRGIASAPDLQTCLSLVQDRRIGAEPGVRDLNETDRKPVSSCASPGVVLELINGLTADGSVSIDRSARAGPNDHNAPRDLWGEE
jgi:hypothetical protein